MYVFWCISGPTPAVIHYLYNLYGIRVSLSKDASIMDTHVCTIPLISEAICGVCGFIPHLVNPLQRQACDHLGRLYSDVPLYTMATENTHDRNYPPVCCL